MFVYPSLPPKDYALKRVPNNALSALEFSPQAESRVTLPEIAKYLVHVEATRTDLPPQVPFQEVNPNVVETWVNKDRAHWMLRPGKDDYFIHDLYKKYYVDQGRSYDPRYKRTSAIYIRSYKYELDCLEAVRLRKLQKKMDREKIEDMQRLHKQMGIREEDIPDVSETLQKEERWQEVPMLFAPSQSDPCLRRSEFALIGQPFKHEACNWYYEHRPPPSIPWKPEKFSK